MSITDALSGLLNRYVEMVNSGDCGFWDPEKDAEVIAGRAALAAIQTMGGKMTDAQVEAAARAIMGTQAFADFTSNPYSCAVEMARVALTAAQAALCEKCGGRGYVVHDSEWEPYAVKCDCAALTAAQAGAPSEEEISRALEDYVPGAADHQGAVAAMMALLQRRK